MVLKQIYIVILLFFVTNSFGQIGQIYGKITEWRTTEPVKWASVILLNSNNSIYKGINTDSLGAYKIDSIKSGTYSFKVKYFDLIDTLIKNIIIEDKSKININITTKPCVSENTDTICPICHKKDMAISIFIGIYDVWFKTKRAERKYYKQVKKQGYEVDKIDNKEYLIRVTNDKENKKKFERCNHWFCKRDKYIY